MFGDEDQFCYDYDDDIDELFKLGQYLVETNPLAESDEVKHYAYFNCFNFMCYDFVRTGKTKD